MKILLEVADNKGDLLLELLKDVSFVKDAKQIADNEITNPAILKSIEDYENGKVRHAMQFGRFKGINRCIIFYSCLKRGRIWALTENVC